MFRFLLQMNLEPKHIEGRCLTRTFKGFTPPRRNPVAPRNEIMIETVVGTYVGESNHSRVSEHAPRPNATPPKQQFLEIKTPLKLVRHGFRPSTVYRYVFSLGNSQNGCFLPLGPLWNNSLNGGGSKIG